MSTRLRRRGRHIGALLVAAERSFNDELVGRLHRRGFRDIRPAHGAVFANLDAEGTRASVLAARARMTKQSMGELIDDLEQKRYIERRPDPSDGRARIVVPTERGLAVDRVADEIIAGIEREYERRLGSARLGRLRADLERLAD
jgi:DNA-binding MarR family transcriptional regulator